MFDGVGNAEAQGGGTWLGLGNHKLEVGEIKARQSKDPEKRGAMQFIAEFTVLESAGLNGAPAPHQPGDAVSYYVTFGVGSPGYDPQKNTSMGDRDIRGFAEALVEGCGGDKNTIGVAQWKPILEGMADSRQNARGVQVRANVYLDKFIYKQGPRKGEQGEAKRTRFQALRGQKFPALFDVYGNTTMTLAPPPKVAPPPPAAASAPPVVAAPPPKTPPSSMLTTQLAALLEQHKAAGWKPEHLLSEGCKPYQWATSNFFSAAEYTRAVETCFDQVNF